MRKLLLSVAALALASVLAVSAEAAHAATEPVVVANLGRQLVGINLESGASLQASVQGQLLDTNGNGLADALRCRGAAKENHGVHRLRIYSIQCQSDFADTWAPAMTNGTDAVSGPQPSYVVSVTPFSAFCPPPGNFNLTYRGEMALGIRSIDGSLATFTLHSFQFQARAVRAAQNDVC